jgi:deoxycytidylate deaminase
MLINAGIKKVVYKGDYPHDLGREMLEEGGIELVNFGGYIAGMDSPQQTLWSDDEPESSGGC